MYAVGAVLLPEWCSGPMRARRGCGVWEEQQPGQRTEVEEDSGLASGYDTGLMLGVNAHLTRRGGGHMCTHEAVVSVRPPHPLSV